jgi:hypothetical protein
MKKKLLLIFMVVFAITTASIPAFAQDGFSDIAGHWGKDSIMDTAEYINFLAEDGKFMPDKALTRSEFVLMLQKSLGIQIMYFKKTDITEFFSDVTNEDVYASALVDLVTANIIDDEGLFRPNDILKREEMVHYIMNAYRYKAGDTYKLIKLAYKPFADDESIDSAFSGDIALAEYYGIIKRPLSNKVFPKDTATRAQGATVIDRLLKLLGKDAAEQEASRVLIKPSAQVKDGLIIMKLAITNNTEKEVYISHNSGQKVDFQLLDSNREVLYTWSAYKSFIMALTGTVVGPGETLEFNEAVELNIYGDTLEKAVFMKAYITGTSEDFTVNADGYETEIMSMN